MHLSISAYLTFLVGLSTLATAQVAVPARSIKCVCNGIIENSQSACIETGGSFNATACGFPGCCVYANEQSTFIENCRTLGYGFKRCDDCRSCWEDRGDIRRGKDSKTDIGLVKLEANIPLICISVLCHVIMCNIYYYEEWNQTCCFNLNWEPTAIALLCSISWGRK